LYPTDAQLFSQPILDRGARLLALVLLAEDLLLGMTSGLTWPILMLVTDRHLAGGDDDLVAAVSAAVTGGVNAVQLREKDLPAAELLHLAIRLRDVTAGRAALLVNGPLEVALAANADGVHLPESEPMVERPHRPFLVGRSVHSKEAAEAAWAECSDYLIAGPVYETASHPGQVTEGVSLIEEIVAGVALPVLAIGGVTVQQVDEVVRGGASGVAVISAVLGAESPRRAAQELRKALDAAWSERRD
jgi:thiamine-phosphate pyrophosphorylase